MSFPPLRAEEKTSQEQQQQEAPEVSPEELLCYFAELVASEFYRNLCRAPAAAKRTRNRANDQDLPSQQLPAGLEHVNQISAEQKLWLGRACAFFEREQASESKAPLSELQVCSQCSLCCVSVLCVCVCVSVSALCLCGCLCVCL